MHPQPALSISPAHATLRPGQALTLEAPGGFGEVEWILEHAPADGSLSLNTLVGQRVMIRIPEFKDLSGIYFIRVVSRQNPRLTASTTLRVLAPEMRATAPVGGFRKAAAPVRATGIGRLVGSIQGLLGIPSLPCSA